MLKQLKKKNNFKVGKKKKAQKKHVGSRNRRAGFARGWVARGLRGLLGSAEQTASKRVFGLCRGTGAHIPGLTGGSGAVCTPPRPGFSPFLRRGSAGRGVLLLARRQGNTC